MSMLYSMRLPSANNEEQLVLLNIFIFFAKCKEVTQVIQQEYSLKKLSFYVELTLNIMMFNLNAEILQTRRCKRDSVIKNKVTNIKYSLRNIFFLLEYHELIKNSKKTRF